MDCLFPCRLEIIMLCYVRTISIGHFNTMVCTGIGTVSESFHFKAIDFKIQSQTRKLIYYQYTFRWLVSQGKFDKAIGILRKFERINRTNVSDNIYDQFRVI